MERIWRYYISLPSVRSDLSGWLDGRELPVNISKFFLAIRKGLDVTFSFSFTRENMTPCIRGCTDRTLRVVRTVH